MPEYPCEYFINRELSWLEFNHRVLLQALAFDNPILDRMKFLSIVASNLDEFFMIRVASLKDKQQAGCGKPDCAGMTPERQLKEISRRAHELMSTLYSVYRSVAAELELRDVYIIHAGDRDCLQRQYCDNYYNDTLHTLVTPVIAAKGRKFPLISGKSLNLGLILESPDGQSAFAVLKVPSSVGRLVPLPSESGRVYIPVEEIVRDHAPELFRGWRVDECHPMRITRNGDVSVDAEESEDLLSAMKKSLKLRKSGSAIRLEVEAGASERFEKQLMKKLGLCRSDIYDIDGPIDLRFLTKELYGLADFDDGRYKPFVPAVPEQLLGQDSIFDAIRKSDILMYHPFDSFDPVVRLLEEAASDPAVLAIKITLYRVSHDSPIVAALIKAAGAGKQVTVLIEARARFDEENNIEFGETLAKAGADVIYGLPKLKTHSKIALVVRREGDELVKYLHLGTGNYNDVTARLYTDYSLLTANSQLGEDGVSFFHSVTGGLPEPQLSQLIMSPYQLRDRFRAELKRERKKARKGQGGEVFAKMNSLTDPKMIRALYKASQAGVRIRLLVRGICCLRPGIPGVSENIEVRSVVGRFLEHSRVYAFGSGDKQRLYLSSADWMPRNLNNRVELMFPLLDDGVRAKVQSDIEAYWSDTAKAMVMQPGGQYIPIDADEYVNAQEQLIPYGGH